MAALLVRGRGTRRDSSGRRRTLGAELAYSGGGNGGGPWGASKTGTILPVSMSAGMTLSMQTVLMGLGDAAAEGGSDTWMAASQRLLATSGNSSALIAYLSVLSASSLAATLI